MRIRMENPLFEFINTTVNFIALNFLFLITCIPVITIGPAVAALYQVLLREARGENGYLCSTYLKHFKEMFLHGTAVFIFYITALFISTFTAVFWGSMGGILSVVITALLVLVSVVIFSSMLYVFPLMARFDNSIKQTIKNAFIIALSNPMLTVILLFLHITVICLLCFVPYMKMFMLISGFAFFAFCFAFIYTKLFRKYEIAEEN